MFLPAKTKSETRSRNKRDCKRHCSPNPKRNKRGEREKGKRGSKCQNMSPGIFRPKKGDVCRVTYRLSSTTSAELPSKSTSWLTLLMLPRFTNPYPVVLSSPRPLGS